MLDVLTIRYCRLACAWIAHCSCWAVAARGLSKYQAGKPVASARKPTMPVPKSAVRSDSRRVMGLFIVLLLQSPTAAEVGDSQARTNVDRSAVEALLLACTAV